MFVDCPQTGLAHMAARIAFTLINCIDQPLALTKLRTDEFSIRHKLSANRIELLTIIISADEGK